MVRNVVVAMGNTGYPHQLDRARRFLDRIQANYQDLEGINEVEFQDMMWSFFQHCWHVKYWMRHDPLASNAQKKAVNDRAHQSGALMICHDLCNGTKHLRLDSPGAEQAISTWISTLSQARAASRSTA